jgi:protein O-GlcNAc transferase
MRKPFRRTAQPLNYNCDSQTAWPWVTDSGQVKHASACGTESAARVGSVAVVGHAASPVSVATSIVKGWEMALFRRLRSVGRAVPVGNESKVSLSEQDALRLIDEGNDLEDEGRNAEAMQRYEAAIRLAPNLPRAHLSRGNILLNMGDTQGALDCFATALARDPNYAAAYYNMGNAYVRSGRHEPAIAAYRKAIALKPDFADAEVALGYALEDLGRLEEAVASYTRALKIKPNFPEAHYNLGYALRALGRFDDAVASYRRALEIKPDYVEAHHNLGNALEQLGRIDDAVASYRRALEIQPDFANAYTNLLFCLSHKEALSPQELFAEHRRFGERFEAPLRPSWPQHRNTRDPTRCLQIGFVSGDLRDHAVAYFIEPLLAHLAGGPSLSMHAYYNHAVEDAVTKHLRGYFSHWHSVAQLSDAALAQEIGADGIDILVDLSGHTRENRLLTFARKPAPVQASWMGYPGTTGLSAMDYYLADRHFLPPGVFDSQFTEKLVYLPATAPFMPENRALPVNALPALSNGYLTFGSFNRLSKLSPSAIALWSALLRALPNARMVLGGMPQDGSYNNLIAWFAREGIARERLSFHKRCDIAAYLALHHEVDICLDTFPYTGGTTTNHALWMGVPTMTLAGQTAPGRQGAATLGHLQLDAFVAADREDFVRRGLSWADNLSALAAIRAGLRQRLEQSPMRRPDVIAAGLERALRTMWQRWCACQAAETLDMSLPTDPVAAPHGN